MRLGAPLQQSFDRPADWIAALEAAGYAAAMSPIGPEADTATRQSFADAAADADVVIAEVHAFGHNPIGGTKTDRDEAIAACAARLQLAEDLGAVCCVNVAGSMGETWAGPHPANIGEAAKERIIYSVREIIDRVDPDHAVYTLEAMPWTLPDSVESYRRLLDAIDREQAGVHFDPVNLVNCPRRYYQNDVLIEDFVGEFGTEIVSVHLKDVRLTDDLTVSLLEVPPGDGGLDYHTLLAALESIEDVPVLLEHLPTQAAYEEAATYVREIGVDVGISM